MRVLWRLFFLFILVLVVFGGGAIAAYQLFFKKPVAKEDVGHPAVITPTPDPGIALLDQANQLIKKGDTEGGKRILASIFQSFPNSGKANDARRQLGAMNLDQFFSANNPDKVEYTVVRGDSIARIANKTKASPELIFKANGLDSLTIQPGQKFIIPAGQFTLAVSLADKSVTLLNHGAFFKWYPAKDASHLPANFTAGQYKVLGKEAWSDGHQVAFGAKDYVGSSRWIVINRDSLTLYSETNPQTPNVAAPKIGIELSAEAMDELYSLIARDTAVTVQ